MDSFVSNFGGHPVLLSSRNVFPEYEPFHKVMDGIRPWHKRNIEILLTF